MKRYGAVPDDAFDTVFKMMQQSFPREEYRDKPELKSLVYSKKLHVWGMYEEETLKAFLTYWLLPDAVFVEHFAVDSSCRGGGIGSAMIQKFVSQKKQPVTLEVELPETDIARRRIAFYQRCGFYYNDFPYLQPPFREEDQPLPLRVMSWPTPLTQERFIRLRQQAYQTVYGLSQQQALQYIIEP